MNENLNSHRPTEILDILHSEPSSPIHRPLVVEYINHFASKANHLTKEELYGKEGHGIAADLLRILALQGLFGSGGYDWITEEDEPNLYTMQHYASLLDESPDKPEVWEKLLSLASKI